MNIESYSYGFKIYELLARAKSFVNAREWKWHFNSQHAEVQKTFQKIIETPMKVRIYTMCPIINIFEFFVMTFDHLTTERYLNIYTIFPLQIFSPFLLQPYRQNIRKKSKWYPKYYGKYSWDILILIRCRISWRFIIDIHILAQFQVLRLHIGGFDWKWFKYWCYHW